MKNSKEYEPCDMNKHLSDTRFILLLAPYPKGSATGILPGTLMEKDLITAPFRCDEVSCSTIFTVHYIIQLYSQNSDIIVFMSEQKPYPIKFLCWRKSYRV